MADQVVTIRPATNSGASGGVTFVPGAAGSNEFHEVLADGADSDLTGGDSTYGRIFDPDSSGVGGQTSFATSTLPALSQIRGVRSRWRLGTFEAQSPSQRLALSLWLDTALTVSAAGGDSVDFPATDDTIGTVTGVTLTPLMQGRTAQAWIDALVSLFVTTRLVPNEDSRLYAAALDVYFNAAPVVTVTAPSEGGTVIDTARPTITWTYLDPEGDPQERREVAIFTDAVHDAVGFDPETATAVTRISGTGAGTSVVVDVDLESGVTYHAYVKAADTTAAGFPTRYSAWDSNEFLVDNDPPPPPTSVVATPDRPDGRTAVAITEGAGSPATEFYALERSIDGGVTWVMLDEALPDAGTTTPFLDRLGTRGIATLYRARAGRIVADQRLLSAATTSAEVTLVDDGRAWLKSAYDSALDLPLCGPGPRLSSDSIESLAIFEPEGRDFPIVRRGTIGSEAFSEIEVVFLDDDGSSDFEALRRLREPLLLQTLHGDVEGLEQYWIVIPKRGLLRAFTAGFGGNAGQVRYVRFPAREVEAPPGPYDGAASGSILTTEDGVFLTTEDGVPLLAEV